MGSMATPHISAADDAFADLVLMPGDPLRAKWIATTFLDEAVEVTSVRNMLGYTGTYKGAPVSVMGSGMGIPSLCIYASELVMFYGVTKLVRVGSCGSIRPEVKVRDIVVAVGACTDSAVNRRRFGGHDFAAVASWNLLSRTMSEAERRGVPVHAGNVLSSDLFYAPADGREPIEHFEVAQRMGVLGVEMEAAGLYGVAAEKGVEALTVCTVSDSLVEQEYLSAEDRETSLADMVALVLDALAV